jgi:serine/threonine protein kinase
MEYCSSGSLMRVMDILQRPLTENEIRVVCKHVVQAFSNFHNFMIHRDVKASKRKKKKIYYFKNFRQIILKILIYYF